MRPINKEPKKKIAGMVTGFVIHTRPTDRGKLQRNNSASSAAAIIWPGMGMNATNKPTKKAMEAE